MNDVGARLTNSTRDVYARVGSTPDSFDRASRVGLAMEALEGEVSSALHRAASTPLCLPRRCRACMKLADTKRNETGQVCDKQRAMRLGFTPRAGTMRQVRSTPHLRDSFTQKLRHLRRSWNFEEGDSGSLKCVCEATTTAARSASPEHSAHKKAFRVVSSIINLRRQPETAGQENCSRGEAPKESQANLDDDVVHEGGLAHQDRGIGVLSSRRLETAVADRRSTPTPKDPSERQSTYVASGNSFESNNVLVRQKEMNDDMELELGPTIVDLRSDLEWLDPKMSLHRDFSVKHRSCHGQEIQNCRDSPDLVQDDFSEGNSATSRNLAYNQEMEGLQALDSLPELDREYQSSDSGNSISDELVAKYLTPAESMRNLLPTDTASRFGSFYSVSNVGLNALPEEMDWTCSNLQTQASRFSWSSSVYSDAGQDSLEQDHGWWRPSPLVVNKEIESPPPIPERNPLRLMQRLSNGFPKSFGENMRRSGNIYNLHLDLTTPTKSSKTNSWRTSSSSRKQSQVSGTDQTPRIDSGVGQYSLALSGHILGAMRSSTQSTEATRKPRDKKKARRSGRKSEMSTKQPLTAKSNSQATQSDQLMEAREHSRSKSEPFREIGVNRSLSSKWNEPMPSNRCIRRSCIAGLANDIKPGQSAPVLKINKQLPPLPVAMES